MRTLTRVEAEIEGEASGERGFAVDTTFVLFFLAVELGQLAGRFGLDTAFMLISLAMLLVLPYFLPSEQKTGFGRWLAGRSFIAGFAFLIGVMFKQSLGTALPETFRFLPMTLLIVAAMLSCYIQFYGFLKLRLAK